MTTAENADWLLAQYVDACRQGDKAIGRRARLADELDKLDAADKARLEAPGALKAAALWYASQGVAVFPLKPRDKRPATRHGFKEATTDAGQIAAWWTHTPDANIGAPTGRLFDVVDVDGPDGVRSLMAPDEDWRDGLIGHVLTGRAAGHHLYYAPAPDMSNGAAILPGVDYRGAGGYVVMPPSIASNGARYAWLKPLTVSRV